MIRVGSGFTPSSTHADKVEIVITVQMARVDTTIVMILLLVAGIVKFKSERHTITHREYWQALFLKYPHKIYNQIYARNSANHDHWN